MKVTEVLNEAAEGALVKAAITFLKAEEKKHAGKAGKQSSHNIGGNFNAVVSGNLRLRGAYNMRGSYSNVTYTELLEVGNNVEGGGLELAKDIWTRLCAKLEKTKGVTASNKQHDFMAFELNGEKIGIAYDYARSFSWVGIRQF